MFLIFAYVSIYLAAIYLFFKLLVELAEYIFLIDESFQNKIANAKDNLVKQFKDQNDNNNDQEKYLNTFLRYDFFITLILGIVWFILPQLLFQFKSQELKILPPDFKYLGQTFAILTILTTIIPVKTIKKPVHDKKLVLGTKLFCALIIFIMQGIYIYYFKRITYGNIISVILLALWSSNSLRGLIMTPRIKNNFS